MPETSPPDPVHCILCRSPRIRPADRITGKQILDLWKTSGHELSDGALGCIRRDSNIELYLCENCGFKFYNPLFAGSGEFYEELMSDKKYPDASPEFSFALGHAKTHNLRNVIDVGCGEGAFLDMARAAGLRTWGVELNRNAAQVAESRGHQMFQMMMEEIPNQDLEGGADLLTLFQVVEHVASPVDFVRSASRLVRPGGYVVVGVPSERRMLGLLHYDPANWPPHHVSRWRPIDLDRLATETGLALVKQGHDTLYGRAIEWAFDYHNRFAAVLGRKTIPFAGFWGKTISCLYRYLGCKRYSGLHGLSIYAIFQKPSDD